MPSFPHTVLDFQDRFGTERACWDYLVAARWNGNVTCPKCGQPPATFISTRHVWRCGKGHEWSATVGTIMHRSHIPLRKWFWAAYFMTTQPTGVSAMTMSRQVGVHYETAYMMLQRLRAATVDPLRSQLQGKVELDETYISAGRPRKTRGQTGRGTGKPLVVAAVEARRGGRVRLRRIDGANKRSLCGFAKAHIKQGSTILTDKWPSYKALPKYGFNHRAVKAETNAEKARLIPNVHQVFSELQSWLVGTHHGVSSKHLQAYLNEYAFRRDARANPQAAFLTILKVGMRRRGPEYEGIYSAGDKGGWKHPNPMKRGSIR